MRLCMSASGCRVRLFIRSLITRPRPVTLMAHTRARDRSITVPHTIAIGVRAGMAGVRSGTVGNLGRGRPRRPPPTGHDLQWRHYKMKLYEKRVAFTGVPAGEARAA